MADTGPETILWRRRCEGVSGIAGYAEDYAYVIQGLLDLYEAAFAVDHLAWAAALQRVHHALFQDAAHGGYFSTAGPDPHLLWQPKDEYDGAEPSPNAIAALNQLRLACLTGDRAFRQWAERTLAAFGPQLRRHPGAMPQMLAALDFSLAKPRQVVIAGQPGAPDTRAMLRVVHRSFLPNKVLLLADGAAGQQALARDLICLRDVKRLEGQATAYLCENGACQSPTTDPTRLAALLAPRCAGNGRPLVLANGPD